jgi:hypothetical protein
MASIALNPDARKSAISAEASPIELILCTAKDEEQVELLLLSEGGIRVASASPLFPTARC